MSLQISAPSIDTYCYDPVANTTTMVQGGDVNQKFSRGFSNQFYARFSNVTHTEDYVSGNTTIKKFVGYGSFCWSGSKYAYIYHFSGSNAPTATTWYYYQEPYYGTPLIYRYVSSDGVNWTGEGSGTAYTGDSGSETEYRLGLFATYYNIIPWMSANNKVFTGTEGGGVILGH
jgi:hypothetical protein